MKKSLLMILIAGFLACIGDDVFRDVQGTVKSTDPTSLSIPGSPTPTITLMGRAADEFQTEFVQTTLNTPLSNFIMRKVPKKSPAIFEIKHPNFDPVISFPYDLNDTGSIVLPAVPSGTVANIVDQVETLSGTTIGTNSGMILGQLNSEGSAGQGCSTIRSVAIKDKETGGNVSVIGPYYFNNNGQAQNTTTFQDTQCTYVMANVLP
ncbi:MAG: hypothetical protein R2877_04555 [Bdellovibrionota bacterium]